MQFESWIDRQIREAMERGAFDNLPGAGRPLDLDTSEDWWIKAKIRAATHPRPARRRGRRGCAMATNRFLVGTTTV